MQHQVGPALVVETIDAAPFLLKSAYRFSGGSVLRIYIEGDGRAFVTRRRPSSDPTPRNPVGLHLALADPASNVAYLARPCQYVQGEVCQDDFYWTRGRYGPEVVSAMNRAITQLKAKAGAVYVDLVGYSGGGTIALLVAGERDDVVRVTTVAGNIDVAAWLKANDYTEMPESLNPRDRVESVSGITRLHFVGDSDTVVRPEIAESYESAAADGKGRIVVVKGMDHGCCWSAVWKDLLHQYDLDVSDE